MPLWTLAIIVAAFGVIGGALNGLLINNRSLLSGERGAGAESVQPAGGATPAQWAVKGYKSYLVNIVLGAAAAFVSWGSYGPYSSGNIASGAPAASGLTLASLATALVVGIGGARWLTNEVDKRLLKTAAAGAARAEADPELAQSIDLGSPEQAAKIAIKAAKQTL